MITPSIQLFLDEDVDVLLAALLRSRGWPAQTVLSARREGLQDETQLAFAADNHFILVTHNRDDFIELAEAWRSAGRRHAGIVIAVRRFSTHEVARRLLLLLERTPASDWQDQVYYI